MDKINTFKAMLPFIPARYRRPLILYIHLEEMMNIMTSLQLCLKTPITDYGNSTADPSELLGMLKQNMSEQDSQMLNMLSNMNNMSPMFSAMNAMGGMGDGKNPSSDNITGDNDFSEDIDNLFKDFIDETQK